MTVHQPPSGSAANSHLPYAVKPSKTILMIQRGEVGPRPLCFDSDDAWREHLMYQHASGEKITKRHDAGRWTDARKVTTVFSAANYCADCDIGGAFQVDKERKGRCVIPIKQKGLAMLKTLHSIVVELSTVVANPQISIAPNSLGGMAIICAWGVDDKVHELAMQYTPAEIEKATPEQLTESLTRLAAEARQEAVRSMVGDMSLAQMQSRITQAAHSAPKHQAVDALAKIAQEG